MNHFTGRFVRLLYAFISLAKSEFNAFANVNLYIVHDFKHHEGAVITIYLLNRDLHICTVVFPQKETLLLGIVGSLVGNKAKNA